MNHQSEHGGLTSYLSIIDAWALSVGCAVGWGAFVMPGTTFLPLAGPVGAVIGILAGAAIMLLIGLNYHYLMNKYPDAGGTLTYSIRAFGFDHGLLSAWFLMLAYIAIMWANATAIVLIVRNLFGGALQRGFHYQIAGYDVYCGEVILTLAVIAIFGLICAVSKRLAVKIQTVLAIILVSGVILCAAAVFRSCGGFPKLLPAYSPVGSSHAIQIVNIVLLTPWAFVGFESISNSTQGFRFSPGKSIWIMAAALGAGTVCYLLLVVISAAVIPPEFESWTEYVSDLDSLSGYASIPTFYAVNEAMGKPGLAILGITITAGIVTGLIGNYIAASRLMYAMTTDGILPEWFGKLDEKGNPAHAIKFLLCLSLVVPFAGRAAIGWIVDVNTIGALIAYAYTSAAAYKLARQDNNKPIQFTGMIGAGLSVVFLLYFMVPNIWTASGGLSKASYLVFIIWSVLGFLFFRMVFNKDAHDRFGKTTAVWVTLLFMIFFTSMLWFRAATNSTTERVLNDLNNYNTAELSDHGVTLDDSDAADAVFYLQSKMTEVNRDITRNSWLQMSVIVIALLIMFSIYKSIKQREKRMEVQKVQAEESNRAKSTFLSNMSHDIRTPMNAIIGYTNLAIKEDDLARVKEYLGKIEASSQHLLALINDVLDMSRIESGKMELELARVDLIALMDDVHNLFSTQMIAKSIRYTVSTDSVANRTVMCDAHRLNRVLLNLISNAFKFTPEGGAVSVTLKQTGKTDEKGEYELRVRDTGMGMSPEFAATVFEAYSRDKSVSNIQGTGLGMAITKSIVDLMDGTITVESEQGKGTEFIVRVAFAVTDDIRDDALDREADKAAAHLDFSNMKLLLVDDNDINREIATLILEETGFTLDSAENGKIAFETIATSRPGDYQAVLMDIYMPVMNGYEATKAIRALENQELAHIPILAMTANAFAEDVQAAKDAGMDGHIAKPIDVGNMLSELARILH